MLSSNRIAPEEDKLPEEASTEEVREESPEASAAAAAEDIVEEELRARAVLDARWLPDPCVASLFAASYCPLSYQHSVHDCACMRVCLRACTRISVLDVLPPPPPRRRVRQTRSAHVLLAWAERSLLTWALARMRAARWRNLSNMMGAPSIACRVHRLQH